MVNSWKTEMNDTYFNIYLSFISYSQGLHTLATYTQINSDSTINTIEQQGSRVDEKEVRLASLVWEDFGTGGL